MIGALLCLLGQGPGVVRVVDLRDPELFGNPRSGYVACATRKNGRSRQLLVISPDGKVVSRRELGPNDTLLGIDSRNRPVVESGPKRDPMPRESLVLGDVRLRRRELKWTAEGRVDGDPPDVPRYSEPTPVDDRPELIVPDRTRVVHYSGDCLTRRVELEPHLDIQNRGKVPLSVYGFDRTLVSLGGDEIALFVDAKDVDPGVIFLVPRLGVRYLGQGLSAEEKALAVMSLRTGLCSIVLRMEVPFHPQGWRTSDDRSMASLGKGRVLVAHDGQLLMVDVGPDFRVARP